MITSVRAFFDRYFVAEDEARDPRSLKRAANVLFLLQPMVVAGSNTLDLSWHAYPGRQYRLYSTTDLNTNWTPHAEVYTATSGVIQVTVTNDASMARYYRVGQEP